MAPAWDYISSPLSHLRQLSYRNYPAIPEPALGPADGAAEGDSAAEHSGKMGGGL